MPGILIMDHNGADVAARPPREGQQTLKRTHEGKMVNGDMASTPRSAGPVRSPAPANGMVEVAARMNELPPEIQEMRLGPECYIPIAKIIERMSQECYNELLDVVSAMSSMPVNQQPNGALTNGYGGMHSAEDDAINQQKKLKIMHFAQDQRARFIKMLVMAEWAQKYPRFDRIIDIGRWMDWRLIQGEAGVSNFANLRNFAEALREPNPDIGTALEILSTGQASWLPKGQLVPREPLSAQKSLQVLRHLNTSLRLRLNIHENLPRHLRNWRVADGRVTFTIPGEFEFDVLSYSEDTSHQWFFLDVRFLFSPAPNVSLNRNFYHRLKHQLDNGPLRDGGLSACFDFLHNFALTHKLSTLKNQALQMSVREWDGRIDIMSTHRIIMIEYWVGRPGKKNWIEIGVGTGKPRSGKKSWRAAQQLSSLTLRWLREGQEVKDVPLDIDWTNLSMEQILRKVIVLHEGHLLQAAHDQIVAANAGRPGLNPTLRLADAQSSDSALEVSLGSADNSATIRIETVTGRYAIQPASSAAGHAEMELNGFGRPGDRKSSSQIITTLLSRKILRKIDRLAKQLGWSPITHKVQYVDFKRALTPDVLNYQLYHLKNRSNWALAAVIDGSGESWWLLEMDPNAASIKYAEQLTIGNNGEWRVPIERDNIMRIARVAAMQLSMGVNKRALQERKIPFSAEERVVIPSAAMHTPKSALHGWVLQVQIAGLLDDKSDSQPWANPSLSITFHGSTDDGSEVIHIVSGKMVADKEVNMQSLMGGSETKDFTFGDDGLFHIKLITPLGRDVIDACATRLRDLVRLRSFMVSLKKRQIALLSSSLERVRFRYGQRFIATIHFLDSGELKLELDRRNPHKRLHAVLTNIINGKSPRPPGARARDNKGLEAFTNSLMVTRTLMTTFDAIEQQDPGDLANPSIHVHSFGQYRITYKDPLCSFDVRLARKNDQVEWHVDDNYNKPMDSRPGAERHEYKRAEKLADALKVLFKSQGTGWFGSNKGVVSTLNGIPDALQKLHEVVRSCKGEHTTTPAPAPEVKPAVVATAPNPAPVANMGNPRPQPNANMNGPRPNMNANMNNRRPPNAPMMNVNGPARGMVGPGPGVRQNGKQQTPAMLPRAAFAASSTSAPLNANSRPRVNTNGHEVIELD